MLIAFHLICWCPPQFGDSCFAINADRDLREREANKVLELVTSGELRMMEASHRLPDTCDFVSDPNMGPDGNTWRNNRGEVWVRTPGNTGTALAGVEKANYLSAQVADCDSRTIIGEATSCVPNCDDWRAQIIPLLETYAGTILSGIQRQNDPIGVQLEIMDRLQPYLRTVEKKTFFVVGIDKNANGFWPDEAIKQFMLAPLKALQAGDIGGAGGHYQAAVLLKGTVYRQLADIALGDGVIPLLPVNRVLEGSSLADAPLVSIGASASALDTRAEAFWDWAAKWCAPISITNPAGFHGPDGSSADLSGEAQAIYGY